MRQKVLRSDAVIPPRGLYPHREYKPLDDFPVRSVVKPGRHIFQIFNDGQALGTHTLALAAGNAVRRLAEFLRQRGVIGEGHRPALLL